MLAEKSVLFRTLISQYLQAKDNNKPHWMPLTFDEQATLTMHVKTSAIEFPSQTIGCDAITQLLVKDFSQQYENVYTFCLSDTVKRDENILSCLWLVGMTDKKNREIKVGCGRYEWHFSASENTKVRKLVIDLEQMEILPHLYTDDIFHWLSSLPYPWCNSEILLRSMPSLSEIYFIRESIEFLSKKVTATTS